MAAIDFAPAPASGAGGTPPPRTFEVSQQFFFDAAHTLVRRLPDAVEAQSSRRVHGHTYHAVVTVGGPRQADTGMVVDLGLLRRRLAELRERLDHHLPDDVAGLGAPTLENLCDFIWRALGDEFPGLRAVTVRRDAIGDACTLSVSARPA